VFPTVKEEFACGIWDDDPRPDLPGSLRAGLMDALKGIGGTEAEAVLVETLGATAHGQDVSCIPRALDKLAPGTCRGRVRSRVQELLGEPSIRGQSARLHEALKRSFCGVIVRFSIRS
jgi:hypothetical protein